MEVRPALVRTHLRGDRGDVVAEGPAVAMDSGVSGDGNCVPGERGAMRKASLLLDGATFLACGGVCGVCGITGCSNARGNVCGRGVCGGGAGVFGGIAFREIQEKRLAQRTTCRLRTQGSMDGFWRQASRNRKRVSGYRLSFQ